MPIGENERWIVPDAHEFKAVCGLGDNLRVREPYGYILVLSCHGYGYILRTTPATTTVTSLLSYATRASS